MAEEKKKNVQQEEVEFEETYLTRRQLVWRAFKKHKLGVFGLWVLVVMYLMAIFADFLAPHNPYEQSLVHSYAPPTPMHVKYKGENVGVYVLPSVSFIDKFTSERKFYEMLFPRRIVYDGKEYSIENNVASIAGKKIGFDPSRGEDVYFEFVISKTIELKTKNGKVLERPFEKEYTRRLLIGYNDSLLKDGKVKIDLNVPTAKTAVLSNFGSFSKRLRAEVGDESNIEDLWMIEKLERLDVKWSRTLVRQIDVEKLKERVASGAEKWMRDTLKPLYSGSADLSPLKMVGAEVEKIVLASFEKADEKGYLDALMGGDELAIDRIVSVSGGLKDLGVDVRARLKESIPGIENLISQGKSGSVVREYIRSVFYSMGREAAENIVEGYKSATDKAKYLDSVVSTLRKGIEDLFDACNERLEKMVKEMKYEERKAEGIIRSCLAAMMKSELNGTVYLPGEIIAIAKTLIDLGVITDPSFKDKVEDYRISSELASIYSELVSVLAKATSYSYKPTREEMERMKEALERFISEAKDVEFSTLEANSKLKNVVRNAERALRYLKMGRSVGYYYKRILDGLKSLASAQEVLEPIVTEIVSVGKIGFSYPQVGKIAIKRYRLETVASLKLDGRGVDDYDYKIYKVKLFLSSWEGKLLWIFPLRVHLFGVENPDNNPYVKLFIMGADQFGRDVWSRIVFASRVSLSIGLIGMAITFGLALIFGGISGYYGGIIDEIMMRIAEIIMSIPGFYLLILLRALLPMDIPSTQIYILLVFILSFIGWAGTSRVIRGMVLSIRQREFVEAAIAIGLPDSRVLMKHVLPNTTSFLIVAATLRIPGYILGEAGLSYLGLGIREPDASWGLMLAQAQDVYVMQHAPWLLIPGAFIFFTVLAFNFVGDALRDALDPRALG